MDIKLNPYQAFCLIVLFEIGSSTLFALGIDAKKDAWLAIILTYIIITFFIIMYSKLQSTFPDKNIIEIIVILLGKPVGIPLTISYGLFFLYCSSRNLHDFGILVRMTFLHDTPLYVLHIALLITELYFIFLGLKVIGKSAEILLPIVIIFLTLAVALVLISSKADFNELRPFLNDGLSPVIKTIFPSLLNFPYGEAFVFFMYISNTKNLKSSAKLLLSSLLFSTILFLITNIVCITILGIDYTVVSTIPLLDLIKAINIGGILTNLHALGIIIMCIGGFYKMLIFLYAGILVFQTIFRGKFKKTIQLICGIAVTLYATKFEPSYPYHIWLGHKISLPYIHNTYQIIIPSLLVVILYLKNKINSLY